MPNIVIKEFEAFVLSQKVWTKKVTPLKRRAWSDAKKSFLDRVFLLQK